MIPRKTILTGERSSKLRPLFSSCWVPPIIEAALHGDMGIACVDRIDSPTVCSLTLSAFVIYAGDAGGSAARYFVTTTGRPCYVLPSTEEWGTLVRRNLGPGVCSLRRYDFAATALALPRLRAMAGRLPPGFELRRFDEGTVLEAAAAEWSRSFVENFHSPEAFLASGVGYGVYKDDVLVSGASSFSAFRNRIEIEVDTHPLFRRRGLAAASSARLIEHCLTRGLEPHWDAANEASRALAEKLGFVLERSYEVLAA